MNEKNQSFVIDGVTEVDDLTFVSHFAQSETNRIQELLSVKRRRSQSSPKEKSSQFTVELVDSDGSESETEVLSDVLSPKISVLTTKSYPDLKDPLDNLSKIDTVDLPERVSEEFPIAKIGKCKSQFDEILVIESYPGLSVLDLGSIVCKSDRTILGTINDTFGQTSSPYYTVILRNKDLSVKQEEVLYFDVNHSTFITDQCYKNTTNRGVDDSEDEKVDELEEKVVNKLKQSYKDL